MLGDRLGEEVGPGLGGGKQGLGRLWSLPGVDSHPAWDVRRDPSWFLSRSSPGASCTTTRPTKDPLFCTSKQLPAWCCFDHVVSLIP